MNHQLAELHRQRARLQDRIAGQRLDLAEQLAPLQRAAESGGHLVSLYESIVEYLKTHPLHIASVLGAMTLLKPRLAGRWLLRGITVWRSWRAFRQVRDLLAAVVPAAMQGRWFR
ncbi:MAG: YqjK family protein [Polaromonas sp.]|nr:YqjK family protein [Polaromonas sp.]